MNYPKPFSLASLAAFTLIAVCWHAELSAQTQTQTQTPEQAWLIHSVNLIDTETGGLRRNQQVLISAGRIQAIGEALSVADEVRRLDGQGRYLMPGLWDMHAHVRHPLAPELIFPQFLANGVTGIREMNAECDGPQEGMPCLEQMQQWQQQIAAGQLTGPRLLALSSFPVNPPWDYEVSEEQIRGLVAEMDRRGVDLIKTYFRLTPQAFIWLSDEARLRGLDVAGHLPMQMSVAEASAAGLDSLEHARDFLFDCFPGSAEFRADARTQNPSIDWLQRMVEGYDSELCARSFRIMIDNDTWYVPTHVTRRMDAMAGDSAFRNDPRRRYIWPEVLSDWDADADAMLAMAPTPEQRELVAGFYHKGLEITGQAHSTGVRVLMGTDSGDSYSFFGSSAHDELAELVKAGLTPAQALAAATSAAAEFLGLSSEHGSLAPGRYADLLLLRRNPLEDIDNIRTLDAVFLNGKLHDRETLDAMMAKVAESIADM